MNMFFWLKFVLALPSWLRKVSLSRHMSSGLLVGREERGCPFRESTLQSCETRTKLPSFLVFRIFKNIFLLLRRQKGREGMIKTLNFIS